MRKLARFLKASNVLAFSLLGILMILNGCKKPELEQQNQDNRLKTLSAAVGNFINIEDMVAKMPKTLLYNLGDSLHLYLDRAQWRWQKDYL